MNRDIEDRFYNSTSYRLARACGEAQTARWRKEEDHDLIGDRAIDADETCPHGVNVYDYCVDCETDSERADEHARALAISEGSSHV